MLVLFIKDLVTSTKFINNFFSQPFGNSNKPNVQKTYMAQSQQLVGTWPYCIDQQKYSGLIWISTNSLLVSNWTNQPTKQTDRQPIHLVIIIFSITIKATITTTSTKTIDSFCAKVLPNNVLLFSWAFFPNHYYHHH